LLIAFNALSVPPGGSGGGATFSLNVLRHLPEALGDARIVAFCNPAETRLPDAPNFLRCDIALRPGAGRVGVELFRLPVELRRLDPDVYVSPNESLPPRLACPAVVVAQNLAYHCDVARRYRPESRLDRLAVTAQRAYYRHRMKTAYAKAARVVAVSQETARLLSQRSSLNLAKTTIALEGADSFLLPPPSAPATRDQRLLVVSTLAPYKNLELTIELFARLRLERTGVVLEIAGSDWRGFRVQLERRIRALGLEESVRLSGAVGPSELVELYERSAILLQLSQCESFGLPAVEAMRYGLPVVVARRSSLPEVVGDGALVVDPDDLDASVAAVRRLLDDDAEREGLVERGYARASALTWTATAQTLATAIRQAALDASGSLRSDARSGR
jgi:glycosyltransferase involved in cell wall biosynthesis